MCGRSFSSTKCPKCNYKGHSNKFSKGCPNCGFTSSSNKSLPKKKKPSASLPFWITVIVCSALFFSLLFLFLKLALF
ncbi:MAG: hypothetical protein ACRC4W_01970 [Treponemataceae bacterium]